MGDEDSGYVTDAPIALPSDDKFNRAPFAERIADTILAQRDPASIVIGVYGVWGDGKTSVLNLIERALADDERTVPIRFNPWRLGGETEMFVGFFQTLAEALDAKLTTGSERIGKVLKDYGALLKPVPFAGDAVAGAATAVGGALSETSLSKARGRIESLLAERQKRVVVLMDDIDRLDKTEIQAIFRLVKVAADFHHTAYILAFDAAVVADALAERYSAGTSHGDSFMEKIVQLPLHLPPVAPAALLGTALETVELALKQAGIELSDAEVGEFRSVFDRAVLPRISTPRMGKRYGNAVLFSLPMIGREVRPVDLLLVEAMRVFFPQLYEWVRRHEDTVIGRHHGAQSHAEPALAELREAVTVATTGMTTAQSRGARLLLTSLFPRTESAWENKTWPSEWDAEWAKARRIASADYFRRYFTYTVPIGDIPDSDLECLVDLLEDPEHDGGAAAEHVAQILASGDAETFVQKLSVLEDALSSVASAHLVLLLAMFSESFPDRSGFLGLSTMERAALFSTRLLSRVQAQDRVDVAASVMSSAPNISFAVEVLRWVRPQEDDTTALTIEETVEVAGILVPRIAAAWHDTDPYTTLGRGAARSLHVWAIYGDVNDLRACLSGRIEADLNEAFRLMASFLGQSWSMETGVPLTPEFRREAYDAMVEYVDAADLFGRLQKRFGESVGEGDFYAFRTLPFEDRLANEFAFIHRVATKETEGSQ